MRRDVGSSVLKMPSVFADMASADMEYDAGFSIGKRGRNAFTVVCCIAAIAAIVCGAVAGFGFGGKGDPTILGISESLFGKGMIVGGAFVGLCGGMVRSWDINWIIQNDFTGGTGV